MAKRRGWIGDTKQQIKDTFKKKKRRKRRRKTRGML